jgi:arylsulfatase A-like enzyme
MHTESGLPPPSAANVSDASFARMIGNARMTSRSLTFASAFKRVFRKGKHPKMQEPGEASRRRGLGKIFALLLLVGSLSTAAGQSPPPNILIILADDLGYGDVGFNGCQDIPTPNIDSIAHNGVLFTDGYVTHPFCSPARAALLTGRYQQRFGHENQIVGPIHTNPDPLLGLPASEVLLPQLLKPAGYVTGIVGKWHLGNAPNLYPTARGFDEFFGFLPAQSVYYNAEVMRGTTFTNEPTYLTDAFTREGVAFINNHATQPFFLYMAYNAVHEPYNTPPAVYMNRVANISDPTRRVYAAMACALDDGVGQLLQTLQTQNILNNTLIFFLSDNGAEAGGGGNNAPFRGFKFNTLEGGIRVPFAIQWRDSRDRSPILNQSRLWTSWRLRLLLPAFNYRPTAPMTASI